MEENLLRSASAKKAGDTGDELVFGHEETVVFRRHEDVAARVAARNDRDFLNLVGVGQIEADDGVSRFVIGDLAPFLLGHAARGFRGAGDAAVDGFVDFREADRGFVLADREDRRVVEDTIDVRAGETNGSLGQGAEINVWIDMLVAGVDLENRFASFLVGQGNRDGAVKASRTAKSRVKDVVAVRRGDDKDAGVGFEAIHFDEQLVESLLAFVVAAA